MEPLTSATRISSTKIDPFSTQPQPAFYKMIDRGEQEPGSSPKKIEVSCVIKSDSLDELYQKDVASDILYKNLIDPQEDLKNTLVTTAILTHLRGTNRDQNTLRKFYYTFEKYLESNPKDAEVLMLLHAPLTFFNPNKSPELCKDFDDNSYKWVSRAILLLANAYLSINPKSAILIELLKKKIRDLNREERIFIQSEALDCYLKKHPENKKFQSFYPLMFDPKVSKPQIYSHLSSFSPSIQELHLLYTTPFLHELPAVEEVIEKILHEKLEELFSSFSLEKLSKLGLESFSLSELLFFQSGFLNYAMGSKEENLEEFYSATTDYLQKVVHNKITNNSTFSEEEILFVLTENNILIQSLLFLLKNPHLCKYEPSLNAIHLRLLILHSSETPDPTFEQRKRRILDSFLENHPEKQFLKPLYEIVLFESQNKWGLRLPRVWNDIYRESLTSDPILSLHKQQIEWALLEEKGRESLEKLY
jgi:hypothetical protein